jgi:D-beta-D-heptose 7-phosphate kinase/D-beta-D-heptose 1-phosphate adenosyltransferase
MPLAAISPDELEPILNERRQRGERIVFTNGVFDLLHAGHIRYLADARALGDLLVVALNTDESVVRLKGPKRPLLPLAERAKILAALESVDYVTWFGEDTPLAIITRLLPDVLAKGGDYTPDTIVGRDVVEAHGGKTVAIPFVEGASSSAIIQRIVDASRAAGAK